MPPPIDYEILLSGSLRLGTQLVCIRTVRYLTVDTLTHQNKIDLRQLLAVIGLARILLGSLTVAAFVVTQTLLYLLACQM